eukprot:NODE_2081_length_1209_cov_10.055172_g1465_i1.p1 GENE.NODE_2081_length_1209_cov_10.055172_g1465_i1~~NODE_2081_length_1209_cov_10.055172_g1465_i1.p1  ORF type:complete len:324 (-),score=28.12 NODE_2081_length_1209_cov_10.055172_g1465_i1:236-1156(-)
MPSHPAGNSEFINLGFLCESMTRSEHLQAVQGWLNLAPQFRVLGLQRFLGAIWKFKHLGAGDFRAKRLSNMETKAGAPPAAQTSAAQAVLFYQVYGKPIFKPEYERTIIEFVSTLPPRKLQDLRSLLMTVLERIEVQDEYNAFQSTRSYGVFSCTCRSIRFFCLLWSWERNQDRTGTPAGQTVFLWVPDLGSCLGFRSSLFLSSFDARGRPQSGLLGLGVGMGKFMGQPSEFRQPSPQCGGDSSHPSPLCLSFLHPLSPSMPGTDSASMFPCLGLLESGAWSSRSSPAHQASVRRLFRPKNTGSQG